MNGVKPWKQRKFVNNWITSKLFPLCFKYVALIAWAIGKIYLYLLYLKICIFKQNFKLTHYCYNEIKDRSKQEQSHLKQAYITVISLLLPTRHNCFNLPGSANARYLLDDLTVFKEQGRDRHDAKSALCWFSSTSIWHLEPFESSSESCQAIGPCIDKVRTAAQKSPSTNPSFVSAQMLHLWRLPLFFLI